MIDVRTAKTYVNEGLSGRVNGSSPRSFSNGSVNRFAGVPAVSPSKLAAKSFFSDVQPVTLAVFLNFLSPDQVAWLQRKAQSGVKFELADLDKGHKLLGNVAVNYAVTYDRSFAFMLDMQSAARQWGGLTPKQAVATLNCLLGDLRHMAAAVAAKAEAAVAATALSAAELPQAGVYTVLLGADDYRTVKVLPSDYKAGVAMVASFLSGMDNGSDYTGFADINTDGSIRVWAKFRANSELISALRILVKGDEDAVLTAAHCRRCGRVLTVPTSLYQGYGPTCITKVGG